MSLLFISSYIFHYGGCLAADLLCLGIEYIHILLAVALFKISLLMRDIFADSSTSLVQVPSILLFPFCPFEVQSWHWNRFDCIDRVKSNCNHYRSVLAVRKVLMLLFLLVAL